MPFKKSRVIMLLKGLFGTFINFAKMFNDNIKIESSFICLHFSKSDMFDIVTIGA